MALPKQINFKIDHLDPMGQGVFKQNDQIYFIPKTLPEETGTATIRKSSKGVNFASLGELEKSSSQRIAPFCKHYSNCQGCHFQHCSYENELEYKKLSLEKHLRNFSGLQIQVIPNNSRDSYRNRIQLHYNLKKGLIGFINSFNREIIPIKNCPLGNEIVQKNLKSLLENWQKLAPKNQPIGHVEIAESITWNDTYSQGGFTQVNAYMNEKLLDLVYNFASAHNPNSLLDLFSGEGNLSNRINCQKTLVDINESKKPNHIKIDMFDQNALVDFKVASETKSFDTMIVDPPRKGFKDILQWTQEFPVNHLIYVSCNPATLGRDLQSIPNYEILSIHLLDMFPSTHHYETVVLLKQKH